MRNHPNRHNLDLDAIVPEAWFQHDDNIDDLISDIRASFGSRGFVPEPYSQGDWLCPRRPSPKSLGRADLIICDGRGAP